MPARNDRVLCFFVQVCRPNASRSHQFKDLFLWGYRRAVIAERSSSYANLVIGNSLGTNFVEGRIACCNSPLETFLNHLIASKCQLADRRSSIAVRSTTSAFPTHGLSSSQDVPLDAIVDCSPSWPALAAHKSTRFMSPTKSFSIPFLDYLINFLLRSRSMISGITPGSSIVEGTMYSLPLMTLAKVLRRVLPERVLGSRAKITVSL